MIRVTVRQLANEVKTPIDRLLQQMQAAGLPHNSENQYITDSEKKILLAYLKNSHSSPLNKPREVILQRKVISTLRVTGSKSISVEVRKKKTFSEKKSEEDIDKGLKNDSSSCDSKKNKVLELTKPKENSKNRDKETVEFEDSKPKQIKRKDIKDDNRVELPISPGQSLQEDRTKGKSSLVSISSPSGSGINKNTSTSTRQKEKHNNDLNHRTNNLDRKTPRNTHPSSKEKNQGSRKPSSSYVPSSSDEESTSFHRSSRGRINKIKRRNSHGFQNPVGPIIRDVKINETITVGDLASQMSVKAAEVIKFMFKLGTPATINQVLDQETAQVIAEELGHKVTLISNTFLEDSLAESLKFEGESSPRAPVVTVMGHVDHGKTSLLDYIRRTKIADGEVGGITQYIGAYHVETKGGRITFLDTPGHNAFTEMRARGVSATDVVVLVVAGDDGVMPQTIEAVQHSIAAGVPLIVAVNKVDKIGCDLEKIRSELSLHGVTSEDWGGDTPFILVSAKTGKGIDALLESILLQAEILELKATPSAPGRGVVIESRLDRGRGPVATVLVQDGTLRQNDMVLVGSNYGRVRAIRDENAKSIKEAGPSIPVEIIGLDGAPNVGEEITVTTDEKKAREVALFRQGKFREVNLARTQASKLENVFENIGQEEKKVLNIVLKTDVRGSLEALQNALTKLGNLEVQVCVIRGGVGGITESDANLALASNAVLFGFNSRADSGAKKIIQREGIGVRYYNIIYEIIDDVKNALTGMLGSDFRENILGTAEVRNIFKSPKFGIIAGCMVLEGIIYRNQPIRVLRDNIVIFEGHLESLRRFKDDANEVRSGIECGIGIKSYNDVKVGDKIEVFEKLKVARTL